MEHQESGIRRAIKALNTQVELAARLGVRQQAVSAWVVQGFVPMNRAREISHMSGVPVADLVNPRVLKLLQESESEGGEA